MLKRRQQGQVAILTIDRANRRNALGTELMQALSEAFAEIDRDDGVAAVVISATPPGFCAGSDLKELATMDIAQMCAHEAETARVVRAIGFMEKPAIAAVSGFALGGGVGLAAGCDLIVTHSECRWHMPEVPNGWLPPWALASLSVRIGPVAARRAGVGERADHGSRSLPSETRRLSGAAVRRRSARPLRSQSGSRRCRASRWRARSASLRP